MSDQSGMSAMTERGALDMAIATLQSRVAERDAEIERLRALITLIDKRDTERNLFDCPSGGWIRGEIKAALAHQQKADAANGC